MDMLYMLDAYVFRASNIVLVYVHNVRWDFDDLYLVSQIRSLDNK